MSKWFDEWLHRNVEKVIVCETIALIALIIIVLI